MTCKKIDLKNVKCAICLEDNTKELFSIEQDLFKFNSDVAWETKIVRCVKCGLIYVNPQPQNLDIYSNEKYAAKFSVSQEAINVSYLRVNEIIKIMPNCKSILDLGAGAGQFVSVAKEVIENVTALEINPHSLQQLRDIEGIEVISTGFNEYMPTDKFDCVTAYDIIEHLNEPSAIIRKSYSLLKDNGLFVIVTQNSDYANYPDEFKNYSEHFWQFNQANIQILLKKYGFDIVDIRYSEPAIRLCSPNYLMSVYARKG